MSYVRKRIVIPLLFSGQSMESVIEDDSIPVSDAVSSGIFGPVDRYEESDKENDITQTIS